MVAWIRNVRRRVDRWLGRGVVTDLAPLRERLGSIELHEAELARGGDSVLAGRAAALRLRAREGTPLEELESEAFALVREAASRSLGMRPFDVQILAGLALHRGGIVEMQTGEGKTLAAVFPAYLNALGGRGVHVLTFNDYLARRDADWMGPLYRFLGLQVGVVQEGMTAASRRRAYAADVTYLTAKEAGFDLLRDSLCHSRDDLVQREFHFALVDEADSLLVDEARVPLLIAGSVERPERSAHRIAQIVRQLDPEIHYETDEYGRSIDLTAEGRNRAEQLLGCGDLLDAENLETLTELNCALHAEVLLRRDVDYILREGKIQLVDEFTGRVVRDRRWPDGLQAALDAKEGLRLQPEGRILGTITLQHFLKLYPRLCGMTGTAGPAAEEFEKFYDLQVVVIPTNLPCARHDLPDVVFTHQEAKTGALVEEIRRVHATGRPVLVGTLSVAESERLARALEQGGVSCRVLNAKNDEREARIIADAGAPAAVTISTNMAGRGIDIRLGGAGEEQRRQVVELGGLYVIGTNRHESVRVDRQLRGRAGRQGDPGSSRLFISLEDELVVRYGIERLIPSRFWPDKRDAPLDNPVVRREIGRAQRIVEGQNFDIRRTLYLYSEQVEMQRRILHRRRREILFDRMSQSVLSAADPALHARLCSEVGEPAVRRAEGQVTLFHLDRRWSEHLGAVADLREGIHLVRIGGRDPLTEFLRPVVDSFQEMRRRIDADVVRTLRTAKLTAEGINLEGEGLKRPTSTWTYLINDDPFRDQLGVQLGSSHAVGAVAALYTGPLLILWGLYKRYLRRRGASPDADQG